jgi:hypothetical protein
MNTQPSDRKIPLSYHRCFVAVAGAALAIAAGCGKSEARASQSTKAESATALASDKADTDSYVVEMKATGPYKAGAESTLEITLRTKGGYHTNDAYPYKFKVGDPAPEGIIFPKPVLLRADGSFEKTKGTFHVPFIAKKAGRSTIAGTLHLSVCSQDNCIMDKVALELPVDVK